MSLIVLIAVIMGFVLGARFLKILDRFVKVFEDKSSVDSEDSNEC